MGVVVRPLHLVVASIVVMGAVGACGSSDTEEETCDQQCRDAGVADAISVATRIAVVDSEIWNQPPGSVDGTAACRQGGTAHVTGTTAYETDGTTFWDLNIDFAECGTNGPTFRLLLDGTLAVKGSWLDSADGEFTDLTFASPTMKMFGGVSDPNKPNVDQTCELALVQKSQGTAWGPLAGTVCGRAVGGGGGTGGGPIDDECAPYTGSYAGIFVVEWSCPDPAMDGLGTINVHFSAACYSATSDVVTLGIRSIMSDNTGLGALTETTCDTPPACDFGVLTMPPNPPATSGENHDIFLVFPDNPILNASGPFTVTSGAAKIANDVPNTMSFTVGETVLKAAGRPDGCDVHTATYKIDKL